MSVITVPIPDLGTADEVELIEICVTVGDEVELEQSLVVLESDKASMEIPSPAAGRVCAVHLKDGAQVSSGMALVDLEVAQQPVDQSEELATPAVGSPPPSDAEPSVDGPPPAAPATSGRQDVDGQSETQSAAATAPSRRLSPVPSRSTESAQVTAASVYAGPAVRRMARELDVPLERVQGSGPYGRIVKEDLQAYVREVLRGGGAPKLPEVDFAAFGEVELRPMSRIHRATARNMAASWAHVPHVTQFDAADITEIEALRKRLKPEMERRGVRLTPVAFLLRALARALSAHAIVNASLHADGRHLVYKQYIHIGIAVDTPAGLVVPVLRDADHKDLWSLGQELATLAADAREGRLKLDAMQGGSFTLSSLGPLGGHGFTPIINVPQTAILGVGRLATQPVYTVEGELQARQRLPLSLSYDHRVINGADAGRFFSELVEDLAQPPLFTDNGEERQPPPAFKTGASS